jgi:hypothetical protein
MSAFEPLPGSHTAQPKGKIMSRKDAAVLASRTLALLLVVWALSDASYLPGRVHSFLHHTNQESVLSTTHGYWYDYYLISLCFLVARVVGYSFAARWLFKGGPGVEKLFLPSAPQESAAEN